VLVDGDFPATVVPWLPLAERGVRVRLLEPEGGVLEAGQLEAELGPATRLFCTSWVFSFTGQKVDLAALGRVCRRAGVTFVVNGSQAVGAVPWTWPACP
jgi:selenocysteine lyase/cysteine desulfurase